MKFISSILLTAVFLGELPLIAHNLGEHGSGHEGVWHYLTEWHHGGFLWVLGGISLLGGLYFFNKLKTVRK